MSPPLRLPILSTPIIRRVAWHLRRIGGQIAGGIGRKPHWRLHAIATFLEGLEIQILVPGKSRKAHRVAPVHVSVRSSHSMRAIPPESA